MRHLVAEEPTLEPRRGPQPACPDHLQRHAELLVAREEERIDDGEAEGPRELRLLPEDPAHRETNDRPHEPPVTQAIEREDEPRDLGDEVAVLLEDLPDIVADHLAEQRQRGRHGLRERSLRGDDSEPADEVPALVEDAILRRTRAPVEAIRIPGPVVDEADVEEAEREPGQQLAPSRDGRQFEPVGGGVEVMRGGSTHRRLGGVPRGLRGLSRRNRRPAASNGAPDPQSQHIVSQGTMGMSRGSLQTFSRSPVPHLINSRRVPPPFSPTLHRCFATLREFLLCWHGLSWAQRLLPDDRTPLQ